jgi:hypothetical protein
VSSLELLHQAAAFRTAGFCELLCEESLAAASDARSGRGSWPTWPAQRPARPRAGTQSAHTCAAMPGPAHVANAESVAGRDLLAAGEKLERALAAWDAGASADSGLLNAARACGLTALMRQAQRRLPEALAALDDGLKIAAVPARAAAAPPHAGSFRNQRPPTSTTEARSARPRVQRRFPRGGRATRAKCREVRSALLWPSQSLRARTGQRHQHVRRYPLAHVAIPPCAHRSTSILMRLVDSPSGRNPSVRA